MSKQEQLRHFFGLFFLLLSSCAPAAGTGFLFFGDFGTGSEDQKAVARGMQSFCAREACEFVLGLGDNFYGAGLSGTSDTQWKTKFRDIYDPLGLLFYAALGNHDYDGSVKAEIEYSSAEHHWYMPSRYFTFSRGRSDFFAIDTNDFNEKQQSWLKERLSLSAAPWKIVYGHHPIYSYGSHGDSSSLVKNLLPVLKGKADFYLSGHDHDRQVLQADGLGLVVSGAAAQVRAAGKGERTIYSSGSLGFAHFRIEGSTATLKVLNKTGAVDFLREYKK